MSNLHQQLVAAWTEIISETNGISLRDSLELLLNSDRTQSSADLKLTLQSFQTDLQKFLNDELSIGHLLDHPATLALGDFFKNFPLPYRDEHTHLTGALSAEFIYPRLTKLLSGSHKAVYEKKIKSVYGE